MGTKGKGEGAKASEHARSQRRMREERKRQAKRLTTKTHHDGKVGDHKRRSW